MGSRCFSDCAVEIEANAKVKIIDKTKATYRWIPIINSANKPDTARYKSAGVITGGFSGSAGGIEVNENAQLTLENVTVSGNRMEKQKHSNSNAGGGGIYIFERNSSVRNLELDGNVASYGGGMYVAKEGANIISCPATRVRAQRLTLRSNASSTSTW